MITYVLELDSLQAPTRAVWGLEFQLLGFLLASLSREGLVDDMHMLGVGASPNSLIQYSNYKGIITKLPLKDEMFSCGFKDTLHRGFYEGAP